MKILLHIGTPKTGSTTLQKALGANRDALAETGVLFPRSMIGFGAGHIGLYWLTLSPEEIERTRFVTGQLDNAAFQNVQQKLHDDLHREVEQAKPDTLILSSEHLTMYMADTAKLEALKSVLDELGGDVSVFLYLREQAEVLRSYYGEVVKSGYRHKFQFHSPASTISYWDSALKRQAEASSADPGLISHIDPIPFWLDYEMLCAHWASVFGQSNILPNRFDPEYVQNGAIQSDFSAKAKLPVDLRPSSTWSNRSDSAMTTSIRRIVNWVIPYDASPAWNQRRNRVVMSKRLRVPGKPFTLTPDQATLVRSVFEAGNAAVADRYFDGAQPLF